MESVNYAYHGTRQTQAVPIFTRDTLRSGKAFRHLFMAWLRVMWLDILTMAILGFGSLGIYTTPVFAVRTFPVTFEPSGNVAFPTLAFPHRGWIMTPLTSALIPTLIPMGIILLAQFRVRSFWDLNNGIAGVLQSVIIVTIFVVVTKQLIGGVRPYFLEACMPDTSLAQTNNRTGLNGVGFQQIMYSADICTQPDKRLLWLAMSSFPSGHAATGFAGLGFLFLYMNAKLKVWSVHRPAFWKLAITLAPLLGAWLQACVLTIDQAHHWYDILVGSVMGIGAALAVYRSSYAAVWDPRFNHVPLAHGAEVQYSPRGVEGPRDGVFTRAAGWGKKEETKTEQRAALNIEPEQPHAAETQELRHVAANKGRADTEVV